MIKFKALSIVLLFGINFPVLFSQEDVVTKIRNSYIAYNRVIDENKTEGLDYFPAHFDTRIVQNRPALGPVNVSFTYYFDEFSDEEDLEDYNQIRTTAIIRKVISSEGMPSFTDYQEFFYDDKGNLLFFYSKLTGYSCGEKRLYFDKGKMIKIKFNIIQDENCSEENDFIEFTRYAGKFTKEDIDWEKYVKLKSDRHKKALVDLYETTQ